MNPELEQQRRVLYTAVQHDFQLVDTARFRDFIITELAVGADCSSMVS